MRNLCLIGAALGLGLALVPAAPGGVFSTVETRWVVNKDYRLFRENLFPLRQMSTPLPEKDAAKTAAKTDIHRRFEWAAGLFLQNPKMELTDEDRLNLGAYLTRVGKYAEASKALDPRKFKDKKNFLLFSTSATNDYLWGVVNNIPDKVRNAPINHADALQRWPADWDKLPSEKQKWFKDIGWDQGKYQWYRTCDEYLLKLLRLRLKAPKAPPGLAKYPFGYEVEQLFEKDGKPVQFIGKDGNYQAGGIAPAEMAKLPPRSIEIVQQLLLWMPNDDRLYWLLGELYNAHGDTASALDIFKALGIKHKFYSHILKLYGPDPVLEKKSAAEDRGNYPPVLTHHIEKIQEKQKQPDENLVEVGKDKIRPQEKVKPPTDGKGEQMIDFRTLAIGFCFGLVVAFFGYWQYQEIRRRRHRPA